MNARLSNAGFELSGDTLTCPEGKSGHEVSPGTSRRFLFRTVDCRVCPRLLDCGGPRAPFMAAPLRTVYMPLRWHQDRLARA